MAAISSYVNDSFIKYEKKGRVIMSEKQLNKDEVFFRQGEEGNEFYQILEGKVRICVNLGEENELVLTDLEKGDFFGEMAIIEAYPRSATAVALEDGTKVRVIGPDEAEDYLENDPETAFLLMNHIGDRLRELTKDYIEAKGVLDEMKKDEPKSESFIQKMKKHRAYGKACRRFENKDSEEALRIKNSGRTAGGFSGQVKEYPGGDVIFKEGETGDCMYCIHEGSIDIYTGFDTPEEKKLTTLAVNDFFGEMGMIAGEPRSATAIVSEDHAVLEIITMGDLKEIFEKNPMKGSMIINHLSYRLRKLTDSYADVCMQIM